MENLQKNKLKEIEIYVIWMTENSRLQFWGGGNLLNKIQENTEKQFNEFRNKINEQIVIY